jgi:hypothetical protein
MTADGQNLPVVIKFHNGDKDFNLFLLRYDQLELAFSNSWIQPKESRGNYRPQSRGLHSRRYFFYHFFITFSGDVYFKILTYW